MVVTPINNKIESRGRDKPVRVLTKGKLYFVFAVSKSPFATYYYITVDDYEGYPIKLSSKLFKVVDSKVPDIWSNRLYGRGLTKTTFNSFPEWVNDLNHKHKPSFYERLVDADPGDPETKTMIKFLAVAHEELSKYIKG